MLILLSPAKTLDFKTASTTGINSQPFFPEEAAFLVRHLKKLSMSQLQEMMKINSPLARLNQERFALWSNEYTIDNSHPAIFTFKGEVYHGLDVASMLPTDVEYSQDHLRILSAMYGVIRPLDLIQPYRLDMETPLQIGRYGDLYQFWKQKINRQITSDLKANGSNLLINLASQEYSSAIDIKKHRANVITPKFFEGRQEGYKMITVYSKKARGMMTRFILENRISSEDDLCAFDSDGYCYNSYLSKPGSPVFTR